MIHSMNLSVLYYDRSRRVISHVFYNIEKVDAVILVKVIEFKPSDLRTELQCGRCKDLIGHMT